MLKKTKINDIENENFKKWNKLRVAIYTRVSTMDQYMNWAWIEAQYNKIIDEIERDKDKYIFDKSKNYYEDGDQSGVKEHRPELDRMIRDIENKEIDIIFVYKIDRLYRKLLFLLQFIETISKSGVFIKSIEDKIDTSDKMWMFMLQFMWIIWDIERDNIRLRTIDWKITKAKMWYYVWWWKTAFWYDFKSTPWWVKLQINTNEAEVINRIFDLYVNKNKSLWEICRILTSEWIKTRDDRIKDKIYEYNNKLDKYKENNLSENEELNYKKWTKKENDGKWYGSNIRKILLNTMYIWYTEYWKTTKEWNDVKKKYHIINLPPDKIIKIPCEKILKDEWLFYEAKRLLDKNKVSKEKSSKYLFSWLIKCWICWYWYNWYTTKKWTFSYRCKWWMSWYLKEKCRNPEISEEKIFKYVWSELERNLSNPDNFKKVVYNEDKNKEIISSLNRRLTELSKLIKSKNNSLETAEIKELEATNQKTKERYQNHISKFLEEIREYELEEIKIKKEISEIKKVSKDTKEVKDFNKEHKENLLKLSNENKKALIKKYIISITKNLWKIICDFNYIDNFEWKDWREGEEWESKKEKSDIDFINLSRISPIDILKRNK